MTDIAGAVVVLVTLLLIFGVIIVGLRRGSGPVLTRVFPYVDEPDAVGAFSASTFFGGLTMSVAIYLGASYFSQTANPTSIGVTVGIVAGALVVARRATAGRGVLIAIVKEVAQGIVGLLAVVPATLRYRDAALAPDSLWPMWYSVAVYLILVAAILWALIGTFVRTLTLSGAPRFGILLAFFGALSIAVFFMRPFGLGLDALMDGPWWWVPFAGVFVVIAGCIVRPQLIIAAAGVILALSTLTVNATVTDDAGNLLTVLCYVAGFGIVWFLVGRLLLGAVLKVGR